MHSMPTSTKSVMLRPAAAMPALLVSLTPSIHSIVRTLRAVYGHLHMHLHQVALDAPGGQAHART